MTGLSLRKKRVKLLMSISLLSDRGKKQEKSEPLEPLEDTGDIAEMISLKAPIVKKSRKTTEKDTAMHGSPATAKKKIWKDRLLSLEKNISLTKLYKILDLALTTNEKDSKSFWNKQSKATSENLWLPTKIDCVDSVLNCLRESSEITPMGASWFSITRKRPQKRNSLMTSFQSSQYSLLDSTVLDPIPTKNVSKPTENTETKKKRGKNETSLKTLKFKISAEDNIQEKELLREPFEQYRWYYNMINDIFYQKYSTIKTIETTGEKIRVLDMKKLASIGSFSAITVRNLAFSYKYQETLLNNGTCVVQEIVPKEENEPKGLPIPPFWKNVHNRTARGAFVKYSQNINSAIANYKSGNNNGFIMKNNKGKSNLETLLYEDRSLPSFIKKFNGVYWYSDKSRKRRTISFSDVYKDSTAGKGMLEVIHNKETDEYFIHYPVDSNWFPAEDKRVESQGTFGIRGNRVIALDPGVRKHLVGYDPSGETIFVGEGASLKLEKLIRKIDEITTLRNEQQKAENKESSEVLTKIKGYNSNLFLLYAKMKNMVNDLHWKAISFLVRNYDTILYPDYRISGMVKSHKLNKMTKRLMYMFSSYKFKERLIWKCKLAGKKLVIVNESYTSRTCGICGLVKDDLGGSEVFHCDNCRISLDRDAHAARNILIKNIRLR